MITHWFYTIELELNNCPREGLEKFHGSSSLWLELELIPRPLVKSQLFVGEGLWCLSLAKVRDEDVAYLARWLQLYPLIFGECLYLPAFLLFSSFVF